jgi:hypothetical protein
MTGPMRRDLALGPNLTYAPAVRRPHPLVPLCLFLTGCGLAASPPCDLVAQGVYRFEADSVDGCGIEAEVTGKDGKLHLAGRMTAKHHPAGPVTADGDVELIAPDGTVLSRQPLTFVPIRHNRYIHPPARFHATFPMLPPVGTTVRVRHRITPHDPQSGLPRIR